MNHRIWLKNISVVLFCRLFSEVRLMPAAMYSERIQPLQTFVGVCLDSELLECRSISSLCLGLVFVVVLDMQSLLSLQNLSRRAALMSSTVVNGLECMKLPSLIFPHRAQPWSLGRCQYLVDTMWFFACPWPASDLLRLPGSCCLSSPRFLARRFVWPRLWLLHVVLVVCSPGS